MKAQAGFTIVELLITILVLGIVAGSVTGIFISVQNLQRQTHLVDAATRAAQSEVETLRNDNYGSLVPGQNIDFSGSLPSDMPPGSTGTVVVSQPNNDLRRVDVTVSYKAGGSQKSVVLSSLIGVIGITQ